MQQARGAEAGRAIDVTVRLPRRKVGRHIGENHHRKFQALGIMHGHQPHTVGAVFKHWRLSGLGLAGLRGQFLDNFITLDVGAVEAAG